MESDPGGKNSDNKLFTTSLPNPLPIRDGNNRGDAVVSVTRTTGAPEPAGMLYSILD